MRALLPASVLAYATFVVWLASINTAVCGIFGARYLGWGKGGLIGWAVCDSFFD
ncbi:hypothetical protein B0O99DRAFT_629953 [Bisporella sp. PMI_857]|nr:hypothetical protein B0O99DRAFT_629953 [Bisporella sp. PMI_857]